MKVMKYQFIQIAVGHMGSLYALDASGNVWKYHPPAITTMPEPFWEMLTNNVK